MEGYFFIADLLGFSRIVENTPEEALQERIAAWVALVEATAARLGIPQFQLISDTVFAATDSTRGGLGKLIGFARDLLNDGVPQSLPIRGAISHGSYTWGALTYGKAVIQAHELETAQDWIGVGCDNLLPHLADSWGLDSVVCFPLPLKRGPIKLHPVVSWAVPEFPKLVRALCDKGLTRQGELLGWEWGQKVNNTIHFGMHLRMLAANGENGSKFHGFLPVEAIELNMFGPQSSSRPV